MKRLISLLFVFILVFSFSACGEHKFDEYDAMSIAENAVEQRLKSPSTADFSSRSETSISNSGNSWTVSGWVDAQNSFGATARSNYTVKFTTRGENNEEYKIDSCIID
ncbi:MAG: hypothetical protein IJO09_05440 [Oscillospiraceae bacterium]|nr:hypothetical protein [Oscillospiraceae bacterium]